MDVLQLADIFENFVKISIEQYRLNPLYSYSLPGFTWKVGLKFTNIKLDYIKDRELLLLLENNIRGGISSVMGDRYCETDEIKNLLYLDANNLYGWAMSQPLPYGNFKKLKYIYEDEKEELDSLIYEILNTADDAKQGYFIECDLEYPQAIKARTQNFPFAPEQKKANYLVNIWKI